MTRDPFLRLALIVAVSLYLVGVAVVKGWLGWPAAMCALVGGVAGAFLLTTETEPPEEGETRWRRHRQPRKGTKGFERIQP